MRAWTPALARSLDQAGTDYLVDNGITDEPVAWQPPLETVRELPLPRPEITDTDLSTALSRLDDSPEAIGLTAAALTCDAQGFISLLTHHPAPHQLNPQTPPAGPRNDALALLQPALGDRGAPRRLRLFAAATSFPTLVHAGQALHRHPTTLTVTIETLERCFGYPLCIPGKRGRPVLFTPDARKIATAVTLLSPEEMAQAMRRSLPIVP